MSERIGISEKKSEVKGRNPASTKSQPGLSPVMEKVSPVERMLRLQRCIGNRAVTRLIEAGALQARLTVGEPGDVYEREADRIADRVMAMADPGCPECSDRDPGVQRQAIEEEPEEVQAKPVSGEVTPLIQYQVEPEEREEEPVQAKTSDFRTPAVTPDLESSIKGLKGGGQSLPESSRAFFEPRFGADFSSVRIHTGTRAAETARSINARAFTTGRDIVFGSGQYAPHTTTGRHLLAHELTHTLQQNSGGKGFRGISKTVEKKVQSLGSWISRKVKKFKPKISGRGISYRKLLKDKKLEIGVAIGYPFLNEYKNLVKYLTKNKFSRIGNPIIEFFRNLANMLLSPIVLEFLKKGIEKWRKMKRFFLKLKKSKKKKPIDVEVIIEIINHKTKDPKKHFAEFLSSREIAIYSGHARYGTSPDFDPKKSVKENFIIGVNSALHKTGKLTKGYKPKFNKILKGKANDLELMSKKGKFNPKLYQVWFFNACTTYHYLDEIRGGLVKGKDRTNLRVVGTLKPISIDPVIFIDGILKQQSMNKILKRLNKAEGGGKVYFSD